MTRLKTVSLAQFRDQPSEQDLLDAWLVDEDASALAALIDRYAPLVMGVCRRQCRQPQDAEDAFQATFLTLARDAHRIRAAAALPGWLQRVAYRIACRARARELTMPESLVDDPPDPSRPLDQVTLRHELRIVDEEFAAIPERYRSVMVLHVLEGCTMAQVAYRLGTTLGTVRGRLQRGKDVLRRRLRLRGIVPAAMLTALAAWPADSAAAAVLSLNCQANLFSKGPHDFGPLTISEPSRLTPLLDARSDIAMQATSLWTGCAAAAVLLTVLANTPFQGHGQQPDSITQVQAAASPAAVDTMVAKPNPAVAQLGSGGMGGMGGGMAGMNAFTPTIITKREWSSDVAMRSGEALDQPITFPQALTLSELPASIAKLMQVPVLFDDRGIAAAEADPSALLQFPTSELPLRSTLRLVLEPLGLKAVVEEEGLLITADPVAMMRAGKATAQWISINHKAAEQIEEKLDEPVSIDFQDTPLTEVMQTISEQHDLPILIDRVALEDYGLTDDLPVTLNASKLSLRNALEWILETAELSYVNRGEYLLITTFDATESHLVTRIYWLEATGFGEDFDSVMNVLQSNIEPDTWEALGGTSTMAPLRLQNRRGLSVSTTSRVHHTIEHFFETLRESHFGSDAAYDVTPGSQQLQGGGFSGGMGGGSGGMGGGSGGMGGGGMGGDGMGGMSGGFF